MVLNENTQLGLLIDKDSGDGCLREQIVNGHRETLINSGWSEEDIEHGITEVSNFFYSSDSINYAFKSSAIDMIKKIPIDDKFDIKYLSNIPDSRASLLLGEGYNIRWVKEGSEIHGGIIEREDVQNGEQYYGWRFFSIYLETGEIRLPIKEEQYYNKEESYQNEKGEDGFYAIENPYDDEEFRSFVQMLIFLELSDLEVYILSPNMKTGTRKTEKFINKSPSNVKIVDSKWNTISIRSEGFKVNGHWRLQACGLNREQRRLIWIDTFEKNGYVRNKSKLNR
jgi:hypothetical protein